MALLEFDYEDITGIPTIDRQHRELIAMINTLHETQDNKKTKFIIGNSMNQLATFVRYHFITEENLMLKIQYPHLAHHRDSHRKLAEEAKQIICAYKCDNLAPTVCLSQYLADWFKIHIKNDDYHMTCWMKQHPPVKLYDLTQ